MVKNLSLVFEDPSKITGNELNEEIDNNSFIQVKNTEDSDNNVMEIHYYVCPYTDEEEAGESEPEYECASGYNLPTGVETATKETMCEKIVTTGSIAPASEGGEYTCEATFTLDTSDKTKCTKVETQKAVEKTSGSESSTEGCKKVDILRNQVQDFFLLTVDGKDQYARAFAKAK